MTLPPSYHKEYYKTHKHKWSTIYKKEHIYKKYKPVAQTPIQKERVKLYQRKKYLKLKNTPEKYIKYLSDRKNYSENNKEKINKQKIKYRLKNKKKINAYRGEWYLKNKEKCRKYAMTYHKRYIMTREEWLNSYERKLIIVERNVGGFWYGNINYPDRKLYCEKWNKDLWDRIDAFQKYKSILSDKTKQENGGYSLSRHHVYWQKKSCCEWDGDIQGYFAWIDGEKYYICGDPNKFVLLTRSEHAIITKNKLKWVKLFENIIENEWGGKCYYTKEEFKQQSLNTPQINIIDMKGEFI